MIPLVGGLCVLLLDFFSKRWIIAHLAFGGGFHVFSFGGITLDIVYATNRGAAWGVFAKYPYILLAVRLFIIALLLTMVFLGRISKNARLPFALIIGGAIGNIIDFFVYGHVIDFIAFTFWGYVYPVFNVADSAIFCGVALLVIQWWHAKNQHAKK